MSTSPAPLVQDLENSSKAPLQPKVIYAGDVYQGQPAVVVTQDEINLVGDQNNAIHLDPSYGILLSGKLSLSAMPDQISIGGGFWRFNPQLLSGVPSTRSLPGRHTYFPPRGRGTPADEPIPSHLIPSHRVGPAHTLWRSPLWAAILEQHCSIDDCSPGLMLSAVSIYRDSSVET